MRFGVVTSPKLALCLILALITALPALAIAAPAGQVSHSNSVLVTSPVSLGAVNVSLTGPGAPLPPYPQPPTGVSIALTGPGAPLPPYPQPPTGVSVALAGPGAPLPPYPQPPTGASIAAA
jgi:hypothetical protein